MTFELHPFMLVFVAVGGFALDILINVEKVHEANKRADARSRWPTMSHRTYRDPNGWNNRFGAAGMLVMAVLGIIAIGTGPIEV